MFQFFLTAAFSYLLGSIPFGYVLLRIFRGQDVRQTDPVQLRRGIGYVFQGIGLFPHMTVAENIAVVPRLLS